jgi:RHS repeat-associated protein
MAKLNPFRFSTKYQDDETDLVYYGYRFYNPSTGRWLSRDPLGDEAFLTRYSAGKDEIRQMLLRIESLKPGYSFVGNQPITSIDCLGLDRWIVDVLHTYIVVEEWDKCCKNVVGYKRIEFGPRGGWGAVITIVTLGFIGPGEVTISDSGKPSGWNVSYLPTTCNADKQLLDWANAMAEDPPFYDFWVFNCRTFTAIAENIGF